MADAPMSQLPLARAVDVCGSSAAWPASSSSAMPSPISRRRSRVFLRKQRSSSRMTLGGVFGGEKREVGFSFDDGCESVDGPCRGPKAEAPLSI